MYVDSVVCFSGSKNKKALLSSMLNLTHHGTLVPIPLPRPAAGEVEIPATQAVSTAVMLATKPYYLYKLLFSVFPNCSNLYPYDGYNLTQTDHY